MLRKSCLTLLSVIVLTVLTSLENVPSHRQPTQGLHTIVIDAGHGMPDPGAKGAYSTEADIALAVALRLGKQLQEELPDCKIIYTRTDSSLPDDMRDAHAANRYRAKMANDNKGDLFIAIHCNDAPASHHSEFTGYDYQTYTSHGKKYKKKVKQYRYWTTPSDVKGTETYIWAIGKNDSKKDFVLNGSDDDTTYGEKTDSSVQYFDSPEAKIMASLKTKKYFDRSLLLASYVEDEFEKEGRLSRGVKQRDNEGIWVLQATNMPSILVETGFISNPEEEDYLNSEKGRDEVSIAISNAVIRYKEYIENNNLHSLPPQNTSN